MSSSPFVTTCDPVPDEYLPSWMTGERTRMLTSGDVTPSDSGGKKKKPVVYWMQRDVRTVDNWALLFAGYLAETRGVPLHVFHVLPPPPPPKTAAGSSSSGEDGDGDHDALLLPELAEMTMTERHGKFLLGGLQRVREELDEKSVALHVLKPLSHRLVPSTVETKVVRELDPAVIVCDFTPIRHVREWMEGPTTVDSLSYLGVPLWQVDAHNVVPVWHAAPVRQVGARTLRPKIHKVVEKYLKQKFPEFNGNDPETVGDGDRPAFDYDACQRFLSWDDAVKEVPWAKPGTAAAEEQFETFAKTGLAKYDKLRNDPNYPSICSNMSPWINHGHISFQRLILSIRKLNRYATGSASFVEEGLVRRELSDNFLYYTPNDYDSLDAAAGWARESLQIHATDPREYVYGLAELEDGMTHDDLWNAAQLQVVREGKMHGFLRMYWAKKILEWTQSPEIALKTAQYFNDRYALDGKDPNGFVGVGWSVMGIHDMGWKEREIFGKIRYMNYAGCKRKFKVAEFVKKYEGAAENASRAETERNAKKRGKKRKAVSKK